MSVVAIWMDSNEAKLVVFNETGMKTDAVKHAGNKHHGDSHGDKHHNEDPFFKAIVAKLGGAEELLVLGPGQAKDHFKHYLEKHNGGLAKKIVAVQPSDHPTEKQIVAHAKKYFHHRFFVGL